MNTSTDPAFAPSSLSADALRRRLRDLAADERRLKVEFLLHLAEFDDRRLYAEAGYDSLWTYCLRELHLRESATARRIAAMRALRTHPALSAPLRDGRLCFSTVALIAPLLATMRLEDVVARAEYMTKAEVEHLVASLRPSVAPKDGVRQIPSPRWSAGSAAMNLELGQARPTAPRSLSASSTAVDASPALSAKAAHADPPRTWPSGSHSTEPPTTGGPGEMQARTGAPAPGDWIAATTMQLTPLAVEPDQRPSPSRAELRPVAAEQWSLRVTMDAAMKADLDLLRSLLSHSAARDLTAVVREALRCAVDKHGKRRGAVAPKGERKNVRADVRHRDVHEGVMSSSNDASVEAGTSPAPGRSTPDANAADAGAPSSARAVDPRSIPSAVRRAVWERDQGCCSYRSADGRRCGSRWMVEIDHIVPAGLGGPPTIGNLRLACRAHNLLHAEEVFGRAHMDRFRRNVSRDDRGKPARDNPVRNGNPVRDGYPVRDENPVRAGGPVRDGNPVNGGEPVRGESANEGDREESILFREERRLRALIPG